ncbi:chaperone modulator CbpM [Roseobacter sinensis]|uniref:Chaperone modulator CbpM n=1 Tax=Roseobacter sinensis TaxID=2931391 RepID=A0ABT3BD40_9RHOB|nr:chaperone modulator CbpM [Roseobacter sp. WL0113]MCV3271483.1 chaperone modulator CbpM [Roseobacter sp. WL0113]
MKKTTRRTMVLDTLTLPDLCRFCQVDQAWVIDLVEHGVLEPRGSTAETWHFQGKSIVRAKKASRLRRDLGINVAGVALVLDLLEERDAALRRLYQYEAN